LQDEKGLSAATARKARTVLSAVLSYALAMEYVESNAAMKVPPPETQATERVAPTLEETARILLEAEISDPELLTFLWVGAETGGRWGRRSRCVGRRRLRCGHGIDRRHGVGRRRRGTAPAPDQNEEVPQGGSVVDNARPAASAQGSG
jgi:hypothetical protein